MKGKFALLCLSFLLGVLLSLAGPQVSFSHAGTITLGQFSLHVPDAVGEGRPFVVELEAPVPFAYATVRWKEAALTLYPQHDQSRRHFVAKALLGTSLRTDRASTWKESQLLEVVVQAEPVPVIFRKTIHRTPREFPVQALQVDSKYVSLSKADLTRHRGERQAVRRALDTVTPRRYWECPMFRPVPGGVSSEFGLRRRFNGQERQPHRGVDLRARYGQRIAAAFGGRVLLAGDHFFSGKALYIDHGEGVVTMYMHLSEIMVRQGQRVTKGQTIGRIGATGRVTGPHLHFGMAILGDLVDPLAVNQDICLELPQ